MVSRCSFNRINYFEQLLTPNVIVFERFLHNYKWVNNVQRLYIYVCEQRYITCHLSWRSGKNLLQKEKKNLVWTSRNFKYLAILSRFLFSWSIRQDSFHLEFQARIFFLSCYKEPCLNSKKFLISCTSFQILCFLIDQPRFFSSWTSNKNLVSFLLKRISPELQD